MGIKRSAENGLMLLEFTFLIIFYRKTVAGRYTSSTFIAHPAMKIIAPMFSNKLK